MAVSNKIRLLIAGPRSAEARALEELLAHQTDIVVVGQSPEIMNLAELAWKHAPHVILLHVRGAQFALEVLAEVLLRLPDAKLLLVIPAFDDMHAFVLGNYNCQSIRHFLTETIGRTMTSPNIFY